MAETAWAQNASAAWFVDIPPSLLEDQAWKNAATPKDRRPSASPSNRCRSHSGLRAPEVGTCGDNLSRARGRWIVARRGATWVQGWCYAAMAIGILVLAAVGSGDRWIGPVLALGYGVLFGWTYARGSVSVSQYGIRSGRPWMRRVTWDQLAELSYISNTGDLVAVQTDGTRHIVAVAVVASYFWDSQDRSERLRAGFFSRVLEAAHQFGWAPLQEPTESAT